MTLQSTKVNCPPVLLVLQAAAQATQVCLDEDYGYDEESSTSPTDNVNNLKLQAVNYLSDGNTALLSLLAYQAVQTVFVRYNTLLTSSAAVERLFSCAGLIATSCRNRLSDKTFEKLLMLEANQYK